jgi:hypothetical protein
MFGNSQGEIGERSKKARCKVLGVGERQVGS